MTPGSLENASVTTWASQLSTIEAQAGEREKFATDLVVQISEPLKAAAAQCEDLRKCYNDFYAKLEKERESVSNDLKKTRGKYDGACQEVESRRKKMESSFDHNKTKAQAAYQQQIWDMNNVKVGSLLASQKKKKKKKKKNGFAKGQQNTYLIGINITNETREKFFNEYIPELVDVRRLVPKISYMRILTGECKGLQDLNETRVAKLNSIWTLATELDKTSLSNSIGHMSNLLTEIPHNNPQYDSSMFLRHNVSQLQSPIKAVFEPSPVWHDTGDLATDDTAKVFLRNLLTKSKSQVREFRVEVDKKRREVDEAKRIRDNVRQGKDVNKRNEIDVIRGTLGLEEQLQALDRKLLAAQVETSTVTASVGDLSIGAKSHNFKAQTFKIPTNCDLCGERIWGLSAKGFDCRDCGYTCHNKCEMKVPAECPGEVSKEEKKKLKAERQEKANATPALDPATSSSTVSSPPLTRKDTMNTLSSDLSASTLEAAPTPPTETKPTGGPSRQHNVLPPPPAHYVTAPSPTNGSPAKPGEPRGKMAYAYQANGDDEVTVREGDEVVILEPDGKQESLSTKIYASSDIYLLDGSGWLNVRAGASAGLVPASYVENLPMLSPAPSTTGTFHTDRPGSTYSNSSLSVAGSTITKRVGPAVAPRRGAKKVQYVEALYDYEARTDMEWSIGEGDRFVLVNRDSGGGWADVERGGVTKCVPANYIQEV